MTTWTPVPATGPNSTYEFTSDDHGHHATLDEIIGLDTLPVQVHPDGTLTERRDVRSPEVYADVVADGSSYIDTAEGDAAERLDAEGWEPMRGYTGQHGAGTDAWFMHPSEFIGGALARDILADPGIYAAVVIYPIGPDDDETEPTEWAVIRRTR